MKPYLGLCRALAAAIITLSLAAPLRAQVSTFDLSGTALDQSSAVLPGAEAIVPHVRTLDAIHLASLVAVGLDATVVTHDAGMAAVARELGYAVIDPVAD